MQRSLSSSLLLLLLLLFEVSLVDVAFDVLLYRFPASRITFWSYAAGCVCFSAASMYYVTDASAWALQASGAYALLYATFLSSGAAYLLISWANSQTSSIVVTTFWPVQVLGSSLLYVPQSVTGEGGSERGARVCKSERFMSRM